ncbi:WD40 repeat domain-containing protein [Zooshikella ganghwensis]|nr:hypothetical protein [Zooshikella ganghwensis]
MYHLSPISGVCSTEHGYVASAGYDNKVIIWKTANHEPIAVGNHDHLANQVTFSANGKLLASSSSDYTVRIWSVPAMQLLAVLAHDDDVEGISFNATNDLIATASRDRTVRVFTIDGHLVRQFKGHQNDVLTVEWINATELVSCGDDSTLRYWSLDTGTNTKTIQLGGMETDTLCITKEGKIVSGNDDGELVYFDQNGEEINRVNAHQSGVKRLVIHDQKIISLSYDRTFKIWSIQTNKLNFEVEGKIPNIVWPRSCAFINDHQVAFVTFGDRYAVYDLSTQQWDIERIQHTHGINAVYANTLGYYTVGDSGIIKFNDQRISQVPSLCNFILESHNQLLCGGQDGAIYDGHTTNVVYQHHSPLNCCQLFTLDDQEYAVVGTYTGELIFLRYLPDTGYQFFTTTQVHNNAIKDIAVLHNTLFSVCADHTVKLHAFDHSLTPKCLAKGEHDKIVNGCTVIQDKFVSVSRDLTLRIWQERCLTLTTPHKNSIKCVTSDNNDWIASGDYRGTVALYNINTQEWRTKKISQRGISALTFDEKKQRFLAASYDGHVYPIHVETCEVYIHD